MRPPADTEVAIDRIAPTRRPEGQHVVMRQTWQDLLFLHWRVPAAQIQSLLPPGLVVDAFDGDAYVGLVPFYMARVRPTGFLPVRGLSWFGETNVRTYVLHNGVPGVWFFSLDAYNSIAVKIARTFFKLPYYYARIRRYDATVFYKHDAGYDLERVDKRGKDAHCSIHFRPALYNTPPYSEIFTMSVSTLGTLEHFLLERYVLYSYDGKNLYSGRVYHNPYEFCPAVLGKCDETLIAAAGITRPDEPPLAHYSDKVDVEIFPLQKLP